MANGGKDVSLQTRKKKYSRIPQSSKGNENWEFEKSGAKLQM